MKHFAAFKYGQIAEDIRNRIIRGEYQLGKTLPGQREISQMLAVNRSSVKKAIEILEQEGILECIPSVGTLVRKYPNEISLVGYLVTNLQDPFHLEMIRHIDKMLHDYSSAIIVAEGTSAKRLINIGATRIIKAGQLVSTIEEDVVKTVYIGGAEEGGNCVLVDNKKGIQLIYDHLHQLGHKHISFASTSIEKLGLQPDVRFELLLKFSTEDERRYIREHSFTVSSYEDEECAQIIDEILELKFPPTALVCTSDWLAIKIIQHAQMKGLRIPEDLSVTGFDNIFISGLINVPLTTVSYPIRTAAEEAIKILFESKSTRPVRVVCKPEIIVRQSTAKVKRDA